MKRIKRSNGECIFVLQKLESPISGQICFLETEWDYITKLLASRINAEEKKEFLDGIMDRKKENAKWDIFKAFPPDLSGPKPETVEDICAAQIRRLQR